MNTHGIDVFHIADSDTVVVGVAHHFILDFLPTLKVLFDKNLVYRAETEAT